MDNMPGKEESIGGTMKKIWQAESAYYQSDNYIRLIKDGYEPFAAIDRSPNNTVIWLKRLNGNVRSYKGKAG